MQTFPWRHRLGCRASDRWNQPPEEQPHIARSEQPHIARSEQIYQTVADRERERAVENVYKFRGCRVVKLSILSYIEDRSSYHQNLNSGQRKPYSGNCIADIPELRISRYLCIVLANLNPNLSVL